MDHLRALHASLISKWNPVNLKPDCLRHWLFFSSLVRRLFGLFIDRSLDAHWERDHSDGGHLMTWAHGWHKTCIYMLPVFRLTMLCWAFIQALWHTQRVFADNAFLNGCSCQKNTFFLQKMHQGHLILNWFEKKTICAKRELTININLTKSKPCYLNLAERWHRAIRVVLGPTGMGWPTPA